MLSYTIEQRVQIIKIFYKNDCSFVETLRACRPFYGTGDAPSKSTLQRLVNKFQRVGSVNNLPKPKNYRAPKKPKLKPSTDDNGRFGIGEQSKPATDGASTSNTTTSADGGSNVDKPNNKKFHCSMCKVSVISAAHLAVHLMGTKHRKNLKMSSGKGLMVGKFKSNAAIYRTPTGSYYCRLCNSEICNFKALQQHLLRYKHVKAVEEKTTTDTTVEPNI